MEKSTITVHVKLFSVARDLAGFEETTVQIPSGSNSDAVIHYLVGRNPLFERWIPSLRMAVNMEYVASGSPLNDGDEVAVIPPVSGG